MALGVCVWGGRGICAFMFMSCPSLYSPGGEILTELDRNRETLVGIQGKVRSCVLRVICCDECWSVCVWFTHACR